MLDLFGVEDARPSPEDVAKTEEALRKFGKTYEFHMYENAGHAFFAIDRPQYRVHAAVDRWKKVFVCASCATMCYMARRETARVGVRELRQNLSVYLRRVAGGATLQVTERGRAVAILAPLPAAATPLERLVAAGRATAPRGDLRNLGVPRGGRVSRRASTSVRELRADRL